MQIASTLEPSAEQRELEARRGVVSSARVWPRLLEFLAVGGVTLVLFPLSWLLRARFGLDDSEYAVGFTMFYAAHVINDPHFSVTYLLFYRRFGARLSDASRARAARLRELLAGVIAPVVLLGWASAALALRSAPLLGGMIELMFLLVGWHYAKQGFGVLAVLSGRRGVRFSARERAAILGHCYAAWAFAWANPTRAAGDFEEKGVTYFGLAHPRWLELLTGSLLVASVSWLGVVLVQKAQRERRLPSMPLVAFLITIWAWTIYTQVDPLVRYVIPALHSVQYLYFVYLLKRNEARAEEVAPFFGPPARSRLVTLALSALALGWLMFRGTPWLLDGGWHPGKHADAATLALGPTPFFAACFVIVNLHHYFMDAVIWRRDNPALRYLYER